MTSRLDNAKEVETVQGEKKKVRISRATLSGIRWDLTGIAVNKSVPPLTPEEQKSFARGMLVQAQGLKSRYGLNSISCKAVQIGRNEIVLAIKSCYEQVLNWDLALQEVSLMLLNCIFQGN